MKTYCLDFFKVSVINRQLHFILIDHEANYFVFRLAKIQINSCGSSYCNVFLVLTLCVTSGQLVRFYYVIDIFQLFSSGIDAASRAQWSHWTVALKMRKNFIIVIKQNRDQSNHFMVLFHFKNTWKLTIWYTIFSKKISPHRRRWSTEEAIFLK